MPSRSVGADGLASSIQVLLWVVCWVAVVGVIIQATRLVYVYGSSSRPDLRSDLGFSLLGLVVIAGASAIVVALT
jgi:hypothetical protein